ncbi:hypothetical protein EGW08_022070, partial [Elysia chlorotica]
GLRTYFLRTSRVIGCTEVLLPVPHGLGEHHSLLRPVRGLPRGVRCASAPQRAPCAQDPVPQPARRYIPAQHNLPAPQRQQMARASVRCAPWSIWTIRLHQDRRYQSHDRIRDKL